MRSDQGSNFVGAEGELREEFDKRVLNSKAFQDDLTRRGIKWTWNPPTASHFGGAWERQIRTCRQIFNSILDPKQTMDDERLETLVVQTAAIMNSRPMIPVSNDPDDLRAMTPNDVLLSKGCAEDPGELGIRDQYGRRWRHVQHLLGIFWKKYTQNYLPLLQKRQKWLMPTRNLRVNDLVLLQDDTPRLEWPLGRVIEVFHSQDGLVRSVKVKTNTSNVLHRPIHKVCLLEGATNSD